MSGPKIYVIKLMQVASVVAVLLAGLTCPGQNVYAAKRLIMTLAGRLGNLHYNLPACGRWQA